MAKYRKKPVVIDAWKFDEDVVGHLEAGHTLGWILHTGFWFHPQTKHSPAYLGVRTLEGNMRCYVGDYMVKGIKGEFYPCKSDIFEATYELVDE